MRTELHASEGVLIPVSNRPVTRFQPASAGAIRPLAALARLARFQDLLLTLSLHRIRVRYKQSRLGIAWAVLQPLAIMLAFSLVFALLGGAPSNGVPYALFAYAGLVPWTAFASGLSSATTSLTGHAALLTKVSFPREILPITYVIAAMVDAAIACLPLGLLMAWYGVDVTPMLGWAVVALLLLAVWLLGTGLLLAALQVRHRDIGLAIPVVLQVWMFATPIVYPLSLAQARLSGPLFWLYVANPMAGVADTFRRATVLGQSPDIPTLLAGAVTALALVPLAYVYFKYAEFTMADVV